MNKKANEEEVKSVIKNQLEKAISKDPNLKDLKATQDLIHRLDK